MKDQATIEQELIQSCLANQDVATFFGQGGVGRSVFTSISIQIAELWYEFEKTKRGLFIQTASGSDLDIIGESRGISRLGANAASAILVFRGNKGTVVPSDFEVKSQSGVIFKTSEAVTIAEDNPELEGQPLSIALASKVVAIAQTSGSEGNVPPYTITSPVSTYPGVAGITNPLPATGGRDIESDAAYRERIINRISVLNLGTQAFYTEAARDANSDVLRAHAVQGTDPNTIILTLAKRTGENFSSGELTTIKNHIETIGPALATVTPQNIVFKDVQIALAIRLEVGYTFWEVYISLCDNLANFIDWSSLDWGYDIYAADIIEICNGTKGVKDIDLMTMLLNGEELETQGGNIAVSANSLPRLLSLELIDLDQNYGDIGPFPFDTSYLIV